LVTDRREGGLTVSFAEFFNVFALLFENSQIIPNHDDFVDFHFPIADLRLGNEKSTGLYLLEILGGRSPATVATATRTGKLLNEKVPRFSVGILFSRILGW
jgi:hypothetical protein